MEGRGKGRRITRLRQSGYQRLCTSGIHQAAPRTFVQGKTNPGLNDGIGSVEQFQETEVPTVRDIWYSPRKVKSDVE